MPVVCTNNSEEFSIFSNKTEAVVCGFGLGFILGGIAGTLVCAFANAAFMAALSFIGFSAPPIFAILAIAAVSALIVAGLFALFTKFPPIEDVIFLDSSQSNTLPPNLKH